MVATNLPFGKKATSAKQNKTRSVCTDLVLFCFADVAFFPNGKKATSAKQNKTRSVCTDVTGLVRAEPDDMHTALSTAPGTSQALNKG